MPEIAEVALMADAIREIAQGHKIISIDIIGGKYVNKHMNGFNDLEDELPLTLNKVEVKGKKCWLELDKDWFIFISFGMTGSIYYEPNEEVLDEHEQLTGKKINKEQYMKHFHIKVSLNNGEAFYYGDMRRFGSWKILNSSLALKEELNKLGPDMLTHDKITNDEFIKRFRSANSKKISQVITNQSIISGVGNYIRSEVLYETKINPSTLVKNLSNDKLIELYKAIQIIAKLAYKGHGASLYTYTGSRKEKGSFQNLLKVYGKTKDPLGNTIVTMKSSDKRTIHYVPTIQVN